jgi:hypothetical protein
MVCNHLWHAVNLGAHFIKLGVPIAWMITSNGTQETISFFLHWVWDGSPLVSPAIIMTDCDLAQIGVLEIVYPHSQIFLCKWHVLRAMQSHFNTREFLDLWIKVRDLVDTPDEPVFDDLLAKISSDPSFPQTFVEYMALVWIPRKKMWSNVYRKDQSIFKEDDTNMLIEAYVIY